MSIPTVVVEDDFYAREAIATRLQRDSGVRVIGEYAWPDELLADLAGGRVRPAVCWVDLDFPQCAETGHECVSRLCIVQPDWTLANFRLRQAKS